MDSTTALTGMLPLILIITGVLTLIVSVIFLRLYRRATLRGMARSASITRNDSTVVRQFDPQPSNDGLASLADLQFHDIAESVIDSSNPNTVLSGIKDASRRTSIVYVAGGVAYAVVMSLTWIVLAGGMPSAGRALILITLFLWPTAIALCIVMAMGTKEYLIVLGGYGALLITTFLVVLLRNPDQSFVTYSALWLLTNLPPSLFFLFFLQDRLRSVGPIIFTFMLSGVTGAFLLAQFIGNNDSALMLLVSLGQLLRLGSTSLFVLLHVVGFALFALVGRYLLRGLGSAYRKKRCSDQSIIMDSLWLIFALVQSIGFVFEGIAWILAAPVAFIAYRIVVSIGFRKNRANTSTPDVPLELLLLRVFSLGRRSNRFFDKLSTLWRQTGVINMIAGPDLVTTAIEPHEFLEFAGGQLSRRFVVNEDDLNQRMADRDMLADPDGRFRVHEFFCHDDTWRMTMKKLAESSDAILMDVRSFTASNKGCLYELNVLLDTVDLRRIVFVIDTSTDRMFLQQSFLDLWLTLDQNSPNRALTEPTVSLFAAESHDRRAISTMLEHLLSQVQPVRQ